MVPQSEMKWGTIFNPDPQDDINRPENPDIRQKIAQLYALCLPKYDTDVATLAEPPPIARFVLEGSYVSPQTEDVDAVWGVITGCEVEYLRTFPSGIPRKVSVQLTIAEVIQMPGGEWAFHDRTSLQNQPFWATPE